MNTVFGEAFQIFPDNEEKSLQYVRIRIFIENFFVIEKQKREMLNIIKDALQNNKIVRIYVPQCMRYYYDENGMQQIIGSVKDFEYLGGDNESHIKEGYEFQNELNSKLSVAKTLSELGLNVEVVMPVMDNELLRPRTMDTQSNHQKIAMFCKELARLLQSEETNLLTLRVVSSLDYFGNPFELGFVPSLDSTDEEKVEYLKSLGIARKTFEVGVKGELDRNKKDTTRNEYYLSEEFAVLSELYGLLEAYFHAIRMGKTDLDSHTAGVIIEVPRGADDLMETFKKVAGVLPFYFKRILGYGG